MSKGILIGIIIIVAVHASLAYFMYTAVEAINIHRTLPIHTYPDNTGTLTSDQINPKATEAYQHFHTMKSLPKAFDNITIQPHAENVEFTDFIRTAIIKRGGTSSINCRFRTDGYTSCKVMAAIQEKMATELKELSNASFEQHQEWISRQPTSNVWKQQPNEDAFTPNQHQNRYPIRKDRHLACPLQQHHHSRNCRHSNRRNCLPLRYHDHLVHGSTEHAGHSKNQPQTPDGKASPFRQRNHQPNSLITSTSTPPHRQQKAGR